MSSRLSGQPLPPSTRRWMLAIGLFAVLPMLAFSLLVGYSLLNQQRAALDTELQQQADFGARELAREVRVMFAMLDSLATSDAALRADYAALHAHASRVAAISPRVGGISAVGADGVARFSTLVPFAVPLPVITATDTDKQVLKTGLRQVSPLLVAPLSGKNQLLFMVPVKEDGKTVMILRASMWSEAIGEVVREQPLPATWYSAVVDQNMVQIARSRESARFVGQPATDVTQAAIRADLSAPYAAVSRDGVATTASVARVTGTGWSVVIAAPSTSLDAEVRQALESTLWIGLLCAVLSALGAWFLARALRRPLQVADEPHTVTARDAAAKADD